MTYCELVAANREPGRGLSRRRCSIASLMSSIGMPVRFSIAGRRFCWMSSRWCEIRTWRTSRQGTSGVSWRSRHSLEVAGADAGRVELLDQRQGFLGLGIGAVATIIADEVAKLDVEEAVVVEVIDQVIGQGPDLAVAFEIAELVGQVVVERLGPRGHVLHGVVLAIGLLAQGRPAQAVRLVVRVGPVVGFLEFRGGRLLGGGGGVGVGIGLGRAWTTREGRPGSGSRSAPGRSAPATPSAAIAGSPSTGSCAGAILSRMSIR